MAHSLRVLKPERETTVTEPRLAATYDHPGLAIDDSLKQDLRTVYNERLDRLLESLGRMGPRYYFRLNQLARKRSKILESMRSAGLDVKLHPTVQDAAFLPVIETELAPEGILVEADQFAAEAVMQGAHLYAPGVKYCQGLRAGMKATVVDPTGAPVGTGIARQGETMILRHHRGIAVEIQSSRFHLPALHETSWYSQGQIHLQSLPAMVTCQVLDPKPNETIVDLNCSPAGKMSYLCQLTKNKGRVIGFDRNEQKIDKAREHLQRLRCDNYQLISHDSRYAHQDYNFEADKVLVDPPCTGLGVVPKLSIEKTMTDVEHLADYQRQFLTAAAGVVRKGGTVVYSVCTITPEECEGIVAFAEDKLDLVAEPANPMIGEGGLDSKSLSQRFDPELDGVGYFIAKFVKK